MKKKKQKNKKQKNKKVKNKNSRPDELLWSVAR